MMTSTMNQRRLPAVATVMAVVLPFMACETQPGPPGEVSIYGETGGTNVANVAGFAWDPEAYWLSMAACGTSCPIPPITVPGIPIFDSSLVKGAIVNIFDPLNPPMPAGTAPPTPAEGTWFLQGLPSRADVPFFTFTVHDPSAGTPALRITPPLPPVPPAAYLPTLSVRPIVTRYTSCYGISADLISDKGIVQAVAKYLTSKGQSTTVPQLLDPTRFGGVVVFWNYVPGIPPLRVPAFGTDMQASVGRVLRLDWAPPGALPAAIQSDRGFFVDDTAPVSGMGLTVTLLPPSPSPAPTEVRFTAVDPQTGGDHPYLFPPLPPIPVSPGFITFGQLPGIQLGSPPPPNWVCLN